MIRGIKKAVRARRVSRRKKRNKTVVISQMESEDNTSEKWQDRERNSRSNNSFV
jgi:hypothetical protein